MAGVSILVWCASVVGLVRYTPGYKNGVTNMYWKWPCTDNVAYAVAQQMIYWAGITGCNNQWVWYALPAPLPLPP
ncbi:MAG: hypothetical protein ACTSP1_08385 [Candidatus Freyarchaeota archaeon]